VFSLVVVALALIVMLAAGWSTNGHSCPQRGFLACDPAARDVIAYVPTAILAVGGITAFVATYRVWRRGGEWRVWHGAGWALFILMTLYAAVAASALLND
jgi:hypothetical protein